ncbi:hypothetical protein CVT24_005105 [Panaeolus cyanescens]|uniref:U6 small nuclear RNA (adenine-(43)-N(6))-methyltransferase n=1 Tax=Panaeolus cyanescens TaxID=181874 RepID=A0A409VPX7_9AGAR|nr:hypothetical protein CVT24_005105 [Panaeolus cyanescens]
MGLLADTGIDAVATVLEKVAVDVTFAESDGGHTGTNVVEVVIGVPNRLNYILWLQDIVSAHDQILATQKRAVRGIDIGTGSTAIYPLLGCKWDDTWNFIATELDDESFVHARENIARNNLDSRIQLRKATRDGPILFPLEDKSCQIPGHPIDFTMCNPPFYGSRKEIDDSAEDKALMPNAVCTGADIEMIYANGGESGFVGRMVEESLEYQTSCRWFTSMLGKLSSVQNIVQRLRHHGITNYAITEFVQGQTRRWAIGWSFLDVRLPDAVARIQSIGPNHPLHSLLPQRTTLRQTFPETSSSSLRQALDEVLDLIPGIAITGPVSGAVEDAVSFVVEVSSDTWSRSARRKGKKAQDLKVSAISSKSTQISTAQSPSPALTASVTCQPTPFTSAQQHASDSRADSILAALEFQWVFGTDRGLYESFVSHITRKVGNAVQKA